jgi:hypothetical protein
MGADNYIVIRKIGRLYKGYTQFAGSGEEVFDEPTFVATSLISSIYEAQRRNLHYGYRIEQVMCYGKVIDWDG